VREAIAEYDELGAEAFYAKYGFGPAREYFLVVDGRRYDSKAILAAAQGFDDPERGPAPNEFSGGRGVTRRLEQLGFQVERYGAGSKEAPNAWLFQANPRTYDIDSALASTRRLTWTLRQHKDDVHAGDSAFIWKSATEGGLVARGRVVSEPAIGSQYPEEKAFTRAPDRFKDQELRVQLEIDAVRAAPVPRSQIQADERLRDLRVLKFANATVFHVQPEEAAALNELFDDSTSDTQYFILQQRSDRGYDWDKEGTVYHFTPDASGAWRKLSEATNAGFVYYRPRAGGGPTAQTYFGSGTIERVNEEQEDGKRHFLARITSYQPFARPVPMREYDPRPNVQLSISQITREQFDELRRRGSLPPPNPSNGGELTLAGIQQALRLAGLRLPDDLVRRYHLSLQTRGFVILAGLSGSGKSWLAEEYARVVGGEVVVIPVAPNWTTNEDLLGYLNPLDDVYHDTEFSRFLRRAAAEWSQAAAEGRSAKRFFLVLDEMNLARVEYYFAKFLSAMERRARVEVAEIELAPGDSVNLSPNLFVAGTVNVDETTFGFADKVYDRAQLVEVPVARSEIAAHLGARPYRDLILEVWDVLHTVAPFAFRVLDEIAKYVDDAAALNVGWETAVDEQLLQKVLPKIKGTDLRLRSALVRFNEIAEDRFPLSRAKAQAMLSAFTEHGFTEYFSA
jgi:MoxR-like ATPase